MKYLLLPAFLTPLLLSAQLASVTEMILYEPFDVMLQESDARLMNQNGWQYGFDDSGESNAIVRKGGLHAGVSPFKEKGYSIQSISTKSGAYKELPETLNGKTVYFSYVLLSYKPGNFSGLRFRSKKGSAVSAGIDSYGLFGSVFGKEEDHAGTINTRTRYMVLGELKISKDGHKVELALQAFDSKDAIPDAAPKKWPIELSSTTGVQEWNAVEFRAASGNTAFDDLRISTSWEDVSGK